MSRPKWPAYLKWRDGRPRWEPGPGLRDKGFHGRDLKDDAGRWRDLAGAIAAAEALNAEVAAWRGDGAPRRKMRPARTARTVDDLAARWLACPEVSLLSASTRRDYASKIGIFLSSPFAGKAVASITKPHLKGWWEELFTARGHHMANGVLAVVSSMFSYAEGIGWRPEESNPAKGMKRPKPPERVVMWEPDEINQVLASADALATPEIGDAVVIALHSGQRMGDVVDMPPRIFEAGRIAITQHKRDALVDIPVTEALTARVEAIRARWRAAGVIQRATMVARADGRPFSANELSKAFRPVRDHAAERLPTIAAKRLQDLRDTAVTRLALADCTLVQIAAITGHSVDHITRVINHYLAMHRSMADIAIRKLEVWLKQEGIAV